MDTTHPSNVRFIELLGQMHEMSSKKQADYGSNVDPFANVRQGAHDIGLDPWIGALIRMGDKMRRLQAAARGQNLKNESVYDSLMDLAVYSLIAIVLYEENNSER